MTEEQRERERQWKEEREEKQRSKEKGESKIHTVKKGVKMLKKKHFEFLKSQFVFKNSVGMTFS